MKIVRRKNKWVEVASDLYDVKSAMKELLLKQKQIRKELIYLSKNISSQGGGFSFITQERKGGIDYSLIPELAKVNLDNYRKANVPMWTLLK